LFFVKKLYFMKQIAGLLLALTIGLAACEKEQIGNDDQRVASASAERELYGTYLGTFSRNGMTEAQVSILFRKDNTFEGTSDNPRYPVICSGTYNQEGSTLVVNNSCKSQNIADPTLLFDGTYTVIFKSEFDVTITRGQDQYILARMRR
jgi:hypothetical protein